jgi:hypothetical protein
MSINCTRCEGTGFLNNHCGPANDTDAEGIAPMDHDQLRQWIAANPETDFQVCDCCGDGDYWYGVPGEHYNVEDPRGWHGPYASNCGLCMCH